MIKRKTTILLYFGLYYISFNSQIFAVTGNISPIDLNSFLTNPNLSFSLKILFVVTILSLAPSILIMTTSFIRISIFLSFIRNALATQNVPSNQVIMSLSLFLTFFVMYPVFNEIYTEAYLPFSSNQSNFELMVRKSIPPVRKFMFKQIGDDKNILVPFIKMSKMKWPESEDDIPIYVLIPAFMLSEIKKAFMMGIIVFVPFIVVDMIVSSVLMSMGMILLPPVLISLPFKIALFILIDGWALLVNQLFLGFSK